MFRVDRLELRDFRSYRHADVSFAPGLNAIIGPNGHGKTNLLEAVHFVGTLRSLRNSPPEALVANGADEAIIRAAVNVDERDVLIESAIAASGRQRTQVNRHGGARRRDLGEVIQTIVFSPDDLDLVKGPPSGRRELVDDLAVSCRPAAADDLRTLERVLKQRNALLKQAGGRVTPEVALSLDVWDERLAVAGDLIGTQRRDLVVALAPHVTEAYHRIAGSDVAVRISYEPEWLVDGLASALARSRTDELRRGVSLVGPHRDDLTLRLASMSARTRVPGGATFTGTGAAPGVAPTRDRVTGPRADPAARRRVLRARSAAQRGAVRGAAELSDADGDGRRAARPRRSTRAGAHGDRWSGRDELGSTGSVRPVRRRP